MTLIDRLRNLWQQKPQEPRVYVRSKQGGVVVNEHSALTFSVVAACVRIISETLASIPWQVYRRLATGREALPRNPVQWLLNFQANPEQTAYVFRRTLIANHLLWGNGIAEIERGLDNSPIWLWRHPPDHAWLERSETGELHVRINAMGGQYVLPRGNAFVLSDGSFDGLNGASRVNLARRAIGAGMAGDVMAASVFQNGASVGGVINNKGKTLSIQAKDTLLAEFNEKYAGPDRARKWLYLDGGLELDKSASMPLTDAQFIENRRFQVEEVCRWYGVPQHLVQDTSQANYAISYEASKNFVEHTLRPLAVLMEQEANVRLFGLRSQSQVYSRMNLNGLLRADPKTRGEYYRSLVNSGVMSINEVRELEELNSIGDEGDEHYLQVNMTTVGRIASGEAGAQPATPAATPPADAGSASEEPMTSDPADSVIRVDAMRWRREQERQANG